MIDLPPGLAARAKQELEDPGSGAETMNALVAEALDQYLTRLEELRRTESVPHGAIPGHLEEGSRPGEPRFDLLYKGSPTEPGEPEPGDCLLGLGRISDAAAEAFERVIDRSREMEEALGGMVDSSSGLVKADSRESYREARDELIAESEIRAPGEWVASEREREALFAPVDQPLFGLHNRDYPSLWGLALLAEATVDGPVVWSEFASGLELTAREFARPFRILDEIDRPKSGLKYAASFPKPGRPKKVESGQWIPGRHGAKTVRLYPFVKNTFARTQGGKLVAERMEARGPLPRWGAIRFFPDPVEGDLLVEPTLAGMGLLAALEGTCLSLPHSSEKAITFLEYLSTHSPGDAEGFRRVLTAIEEFGSRGEVVEANLDYFANAVQPKTHRKHETFASSMTQGYVARGREWGLIEADLTPEGYLLTETGRSAIELLGDRD